MAEPGHGTFTKLFQLIESHLADPVAHALQGALKMLFDAGQDLDTPLTDKSLQLLHDNVVSDEEDDKVDVAEFILLLQQAKGDWIGSAREFFAVRQRRDQTAHLLLTAWKVNLEEERQQRESEEES